MTLLGETQKPAQRTEHQQRSHSGTTFGTVEVFPAGYPDVVVAGGVGRHGAHIAVLFLFMDILFYRLNGIGEGFFLRRILPFVSGWLKVSVDLSLWFFNEQNFPLGENKC